MATSTANILLDNTTAALFRAWGSALSAAMSACGLVQTADTGQINWTTVAAPTTTSQSMGYEIWRFNDTLQATKPVFIKIEYGSGGSGATLPGLWITVGTTTNGAGTLTTLVTGRKVLTNIVGAIAAYASPYYASGDLSSINLMLGYSTTVSVTWNWTGGWTVERSRDANGTPNGDGVFIFTINGPSATTFQVLSFTNGLVGTNDANYSTFPLTSRLTSLNTGTDILFVPLVLTTPKTQGPPLGWLGCYYNEVPRGVPITVVIAGVSRTYMPITGVSNLVFNNNGTLSMGILMRYE